MQNSTYVDDAGLQRFWAKIKAAIAAATTGTTLVNSVYPVGSIYISINNVNPSTLFSGTTWTAVDIFVSTNSNTVAYAFKRTA